jgi:UDP-N-acetylglucosamine 2-epimerase (non-hydrolysing)/GDP/UDP-N,N'-diacetylbacillosamine 2-epimerase (hydrolysing)
MKAVQGDPDLKLQVVATGMHLSPEFGLTYKAIEDDGFPIDEKVEMLVSSDTPVGVAKSIGLGVIGFADALDRLRPDLLVVLGDRYEILAAAQAALVARIPIAHIAGGDTTEGAFDEAIRHSITKMSHLHFVTHEESARRVRQLGENPDHVYTVGSPAIDRIKRIALLGREELERQLGFRFRRKNLLITFHPPTLDSRPAGDQFKELLEALDGFGEEVGLIFTLPNADPDGRVLIRMIDAFVSGRPNACAHASLGQQRYLSVIAQVDAVVGNSSSGIYEVPSLKKPTVNIGDRQKGRLQATSVINCIPEAAAIRDAIREAFGKNCSAVINPYGNGETSSKILAVLKNIPEPNALLKKHFYTAGGQK